MSNIVVSDPVKIGEGVQAYLSFTVSSTRPDATSVSVSRRFSEFVWLHDQLVKQCPGYIVPPLPEKVVGILQTSDFINHRRVALEIFLQRIAAHAALRAAEAFQAFLTLGDREFLSLKNGNPILQGSVAEKKEQITNWWGKAYQKFSENEKVKLLAAKAGKDLPSVKTHEDLEFDSIANYVDNLHNQLKSLHTKASGIQKSGRAMASAWTDFAVSISWLAESESTQPEMVDTNIAAVEPMIELHARQTENQLRDFTEKLGDYVRWVSALQMALKVREDRRFAYQAEVAAVAKLISSDDSCDSVIMAKKKAAAAKRTFDEVHNRVISEVERFKAEKVAYLKTLFFELAQLQMKYNGEMTAAVNAMLPRFENTMASLSRSHFNIEAEASTSPQASKVDDNVLENCFNGVPYGEVAL